MKIYYNIEYADGLTDKNWNQDYVEVKKAKGDTTEGIKESLLAVETKDEAKKKVKELNERWPALPHRAVPMIIDEWLTNEINETE